MATSRMHPQICFDPSQQIRPMLDETNLLSKRPGKIVYQHTSVEYWNPAFFTTYKYTYTYMRRLAPKKWRYTERERERERDIYIYTHRDLCFFYTACPTCSPCRRSWILVSVYFYVFAHACWCQSSPSEQSASGVSNLLGQGTEICEELRL